VWTLPADAPDEYIHTSEGLFPQVMAARLSADPNNAESVRLALVFSTVGRFLARSIHDARLVDLHFSPFFLDLLSHWSHWLRSPVLLSPLHLQLVDTTMGTSMQRLLDLAQQTLHGTEQQKKESVAAIRGMGLDFTLPGAEDVPLIDGGDTRSVDETNVIEYVWRSCHMLLFALVKPHMTAVMEGFEEAMPSGALAVFDDDELEALLCGRLCDATTPLWTREELSAAIVCAHGYTSDSQEIIDLLDILCIDFSPEQQQLFMTFLTGSPRLPPGGITAVQPKITVVRKGAPMPQFVSTTEDDSANSLPSCNTCFHYLKLPSYGSKDLLKSKLQLAILEGRGAFNLS
jgi:E3 ubiquitin-protein ligase TRIP12